MTLPAYLKGQQIPATSAAVATALTGPADLVAATSEVLLYNPGPLVVNVLAGDATAQADASCWPLEVGRAMPCPKGSATYLSIYCASGTQQIVVVGAGANPVPAGAVPPSFRRRPTVLGIPTARAAVSYLPGDTDGTAPITHAAQWLLDGLPYSTDPSPTLQDADVGKTLSIEDTASNSAGSRKAVSLGVTVQAAIGGPLPVITTPPVITSATDHAAPTYTPAASTSTPSPTITYYLLKNGTTVASGATAIAAYTSAVQGDVLRIRAIPSNINGTGAPVDSADVTVTAATFKAQAMVGMNVTGTNSTLPHRLYTNAFYNGARMCKIGQPGVNCARDSTTGWPTEAFYVCLSQGTNGLDAAVPAGTYTWSYSYPTAGSAVTLTMQASGANTPVCSGVSNFVLNAAVVNGSVTTRSFSFTLGAGGTLTLSFDGPVSFADCPIDGQASVVGQPMFRNEALAYYAQSPLLRTLDFTQANSRADSTWSTRPPDYSGPQLAQDVPSWERTFAFVLAVLNYPGSKTQRVQINLPLFSDDDYAGHVATVANTLGVPGVIDPEYANEPWQSAVGASDRFHSWENLAMASANGIANYEVVASPGTVAGPGQVISSMVLDTTGTVTVTLTVACASLLDANSQPYIVNGATAVVAASATAFNKTATPDINQTVTIANVSGSTFTYSVPTTGTSNSAPGQVTMFFKPTATLLADNLGFTVSNMRVKWTVWRTYQAAIAWRAVRPRGMGDKFYLNLQPFGDLTSVPNKFPPFEFAYAKYLGGGSVSSWLDAAAMGTYAAPAGTVAAFDDLYDPTKTTSLYYALNGAGNVSSVEHRVRAFVFQCLLNGIEPWCYEGGIALQTTSSSAFATQVAVDPRTETYLTAHLDVVLRNGMRRMLIYHGSPRIVVNGSSGNSAWQALQYFTDSIHSGDANYSAKRAAFDKYATAVSYTSVNGSDAATLDVSTCQEVTEKTGTSVSNGINATNGAQYWNGATGLTRDASWLHCFNVLRPYTLTFTGTDSQATPVKLIAFGIGLSGETLLGTEHLVTNGVTSAGTGSTVGPCADPITWTPPQRGHYAFRAQIEPGGSGPGIKSLVIA